MKNKLGIVILIITLTVGFGLLTACSDTEKLIVNDQIDENSVKQVKKTSITTKELAEKLDDDNLVIIDIRSSAEYNGWKLSGEKRGGHIKGAIDFPMSWILNDEGKRRKDKELKDLLEAKGVVSDKSIVIYDAKGETTDEMVAILKELGYENVLSYDAGLVEWASDERLPMDRLANYEKLVYPEWVNELINDENPDTYSGKGYKILEVSWGEPVDYNKGHIPGSIHLDTNKIEEEPLWNRVSDEAIEKMLLENGIAYDTTVILYGADTTAAARAASIMMYAGVDDVRLLNGGYKAWTDGGFEVETEAQTPVPVKEFGVKVPSRPEYIIDTKEAKEFLLDDNAQLVSIRSWAEYLGKTSGYTYIKPKGRIAGAVWGHAGSDPYHMEDYRNIDNTMRNFHEIDKNWQDWGINSDQKLAFSCGTGWRASEAFFDAYLMGWKNIAVYDGGWYEWSMDENNPVEIGDPKK